MTDKKNSGYKTHQDKLEVLSKDIKDIYEEICNYIEALGDDIVANQLKDYLAYKKVQNVVCIEIFSKQLQLFLRIDPDSVEIEEGFSKDMRGIGHHGTGDLQVTVKNENDIEKAKKLIERAYSEN